VDAVPIRPIHPFDLLHPMPIKTLAAVAALLAAAPLAAQTPIAAGQTVSGTLEEGDAQTEDGALYDAYVIRGRPGDRVVVRMRSADFDTYLHWGRERDGEWMDEEENDDAGEGTDSRLVLRLDGDGEYELRAAAFEEDEEGEYELQVTSIAGEVQASRLRVGQTVRGELGDGDYEGEAGLEDHYRIEGAPGSQITVYAESDDFDTYLEFGTWSGGELEMTSDDDDGGQGTNSEMVAEFGDAGVHHVVVRSFSGDEAGAYTLRVVEGAVSDEWNDEGDDGDGGDYDEEDHDHGEDADMDVDVDVSVHADDYDSDVTMVDTVPIQEVFTGMGWTILRIEEGQTVEGMLDIEDRRTGEGDRYEDFVYEAREGERLTILASSDEIDTYVFIGRGPDAEMEALGEDDDSGPGTDSELDFTVPESGEYVIRIAAAIPGQTGAYRLLVRSSR
jgi:3'-phosphoadenosine 5'-phosphosulfate sulfotransferase